MCLTAGIHVDVFFHVFTKIKILAVGILKFLKRSYLVLKDLDLQPRKQDFGESCSLEVAVRLASVQIFKEKLQNIAKLKEI